MREKVFAGAVLIVTALLCIFMPKISSKLKPKPVFTQEFAAGVVEEVGNHEELMKNHGLYRTLVEEQNELEVEE